MKSLIVIQSFSINKAGGLSIIIKDTLSYLKNTNCDISVLTTKNDYDTKLDDDKFKKQNKTSIIRVPVNIKKELEKIYTGSNALNNKKVNKYFDLIKLTFLTINSIFRPSLILILKQKYNNLVAYSYIGLVAITIIKYLIFWRDIKISFISMFTYYNTKNFFLDYLLKICFKSCEKTAFVSNSAKQNLEKSFRIKAKNPEIIYPSVTIQRDTVLKKKSTYPNKPRLLFAGRVVKDKGIEKILEIDDFSSKNNLCLDISIAGLATEEDIKKQLNKSNIKQLGYLSQEQLINEYFENSILILPSRSTEGAPLVIIDALSTGMAVITTTNSLGGKEEINIFNKTNGENLNKALDYDQPVSDYINEIFKIQTQLVSLSRQERQESNWKVIGKYFSIKNFGKYESFF